MQRSSKQINQVYSKDKGETPLTNRQEAPKSQNQTQGQEGEADKSGWGALLKAMVNDCCIAKKNKAYYSAVQARMHKNLNEREIEFGPHQMISNFAFEGDLLAASSKNGLIYTYKVTDESIDELGQIAGHYTEIEALEVAKQGALVFSSSKNRPLMVSTRRESGLSSKAFDSINLQNHVKDNISFQSLAWMKEISSLVTLDQSGNLIFIVFETNTNNCKEVVPLGEIVSEYMFDAVTEFRISRSERKLAILSKKSGGAQIKVLYLAKSEKLTVESTEKIDVDSEISDFCLSDNGEFIAVRTQSGHSNVWKKSNHEKSFTKVLENDFFMKVNEDSTNPKISLSSRGNYFTVSDNKSDEILVYKSSNMLSSGQSSGNTYRPTLQLESKLGLRKMEIVSNEQFVICMFNSTSIKIFSIVHQEPSNDQPFALHRRSSSLLGNNRYEQITKYFKQNNVLHIEQAFDGSKTYLVSEEFKKPGKAEVGNKEQTDKEQAQNTPSQMSMINLDHDIPDRQNPQNQGQKKLKEERPEGGTLLEVSIWNTGQTAKKQLRMESLFTIPLKPLKTNEGVLVKLSKINLQSASSEGENNQHLYKFRDVVVNLQQRERDYFFRASKDFSTILLGSENHVHLWKRQGMDYELTGSAPIDTTIKIDSISFLGGSGGFMVGGRDNKLRIYSDAGQLIQTIEAHSLRISSCASSPSGDMIVTGSFDRSLKIWSHQEDKQGKQFLLTQTFDMVHQSRVAKIAVSEDCKTIISSSESEVVILAKEELQ